MLPPDVAPEIVTRRRRSIYTDKNRLMDALPKRQSVRLTARQKRSLLDAVKEHRDMMQSMEAAAAAANENPKILKKRFVPKNTMKVSAVLVKISTVADHVFMHVTRPSS